MNQSINQASETDWVGFQASPIHGRGGFARTDIPAGTPLIEYVGEIIDKAESIRRCEENNEYIFTLDDERDIDGSVDWNPARFINHSCEPNCDAEICDGRIWISANRFIRAGEELTFSYDFDLVDYKDYPCRCGAPGCVGYMLAEEFFDHVRKQRAGSG